MTELATTPNPTKSKTGSSLRRVEDAHLLVGKGRFTDNRPQWPVTLTLSVLTGSRTNCQHR